MTKFVELTEEFIDKIVADELKDIFLRNIGSGENDDLEILDACEKLLMYILPSREARSWIIENRYPEND